MERMNITLPPKLLEEIDEICDINMISRSQFVRQALRFYLNYINDDEEEKK